MVLIKRGNTISNTMKIEANAVDEMISIVDSTSRISVLFFPAELSTTLCTHGMTLQIRQSLVAPHTNEHRSSDDIDAEQLIDVSKNKNASQKRTYQYTIIAGIAREIEERNNTDVEISENMIMRILETNLTSQHTCTYAYTNAKNQCSTLLINYIGKEKFKLNFNGTWYYTCMFIELKTLSNEKPNLATEQDVRYQSITMQQPNSDTIQETSEEYKHVFILKIRKDEEKYNARKQL